MIVAFSTSCVQTSVALLGEDGGLLASASERAPGRASGACLALLDGLLVQTGRTLDEATAFAADLGPGSFTGVRVGVTLAKTFAFVQGTEALGASAFDLIDPQRVVVFPSKRGEWFVRRPGEEPYRTTEIPAEECVGFGIPEIAEVYPTAAAFGALLPSLRRVEPTRLLPEYRIEPSISQPKRPYGEPHG